MFILGMIALLRQHKNYASGVVRVYVFAVISLVFLMREQKPVYRISFLPFVAARKGLEFGGGILKSILTGNVRVVNWISLEGIILNILLFIPFGYLLPLIWDQTDRWWKVTLLGLCASLIIELLQLITRLGYSDVDDLINNTVGALIGYGIYKAILRKSSND